MVDEPTRITETKSSILDLFLTNNDTLVNQTRVIPGISDHEAVFIESSLRPTKKSSSPRPVYKYHRADYEGFKKEFREFARDINEQATEMDSQTIWTSFKTTIHRLMEKYIPHKTVRGDKKPKPWITKTIRALHRKRNKLFKKQRATRKSRDIDNYKKMKSNIQRAERQAYWQHVEEVIDPGDPEIDDRPGKQKRFWSFIKSLKKDNSGIAPLKDRGKMHADPVDKANILNHQYESVYTCLISRWPRKGWRNFYRRSTQAKLVDPIWYQLGYETWPKRFLQSSLPYSRGFIKRREAGIFPFYSGMFPLLFLINLYRVYRQILSNHPPTLPWYPDAKNVNETPAIPEDHRPWRTTRRLEIS